MNRLRINLGALAHNLACIDRIVGGRGGSWTLVTKVLCGHTGLLDALVRLGVGSMGDTRLDNLRSIGLAGPAVQRWYLRIPPPSAAAEVVALSDVSLNSEIETIRQIDAAAGAAGVRHGIVVMIELGDLREGVLPGSLVDFYTSIFSLPHTDVLGIGANLGCLSGTVPSVDQIMQLVLYRELLELKFGHTLPVVSAGTSAVMSIIEHARIPASVNHWRIGEAAFLGSDLVNGGTLEGFRDDVCILDAEIAEIKNKSMTPLGESGDVAPFEPVGEGDILSPGQRGVRALVTVGELDVDVRGLRPLDPRCRVVGASSDITVVHIDDEEGVFHIGDTLSFRLGYSALLRVMNGRYIDKSIEDGEAVLAHPLRACNRAQQLFAAEALLRPVTQDKT